MRRIEGEAWGEEERKKTYQLNMTTAMRTRKAARGRRRGWCRGACLLLLGMVFAVSLAGEEEGCHWSLNLTWIFCLTFLRRAHIPLYVYVDGGMCVSAEHKCVLTQGGLSGEFDETKKIQETSKVEE